jgi:hypothetical protein
VELPFTIEEFFELFVEYNVSIWPLQIVFYVLGAVTVGLAFTRRLEGDMVIAAILAFFWFWMGAMYHLFFFSSLTPVGYVFGAFFIVQGALLQWRGVLRKKLRFRCRWDTYSAFGAAMILYAMVVYPMIGWHLGHHYPLAPMFGAAPCPTTIFTFGMLLWLTGRTPKYLLVIPFLWSIVGTSAALNLGVREDFAMLPSAVVATLLILWRDRRSKPTDEAGSDAAEST